MTGVQREGRLTHSLAAPPEDPNQFGSEAQSVLDSALVEVSNDEHYDSYTF